MHEHFGIPIPAEYPLEKAGPLMCSGITVWDPLVHFGAGNGGKKVAVAGVGGLGVFAIKLARALGNEVTGLTTNPNKRAKIEEFGATCLVLSDADALAAAAKSFDLILDTIPKAHDLMQYVPLLAHDGTHVLLGLNTEPYAVSGLPLVFGRTRIAGACIAGIQSTQDCMAFCAKHKIFQETELIPVDRLNEAFEKLEQKNDLPVRYVLDIAGTLPSPDDISDPYEDA